MFYFWRCFVTANPELMSYWVRQFFGRAAKPAPYVADAPSKFPESGLGYSQFNECFLALHANRISERFFEYIFNGRAIPNLQHLDTCVTAYRKKAMLKYGSFFHALNVLSWLTKPVIELEFKEFEVKSVDQFKNRHAPFYSLKSVIPEDTHYLGYISGADPSLAGPRRDEAIEKGKYNHDVYLDFDHMDVYVATSMRERLDFGMLPAFWKS